ncbi:hypothetical protein ANN_11330 [Periplaneta americana]|uniref:Uncharacterized protein n=1 Tax=Periplaneta americana TaxID=6978 RepID=A0ABQ8T4Q1_PERAM|nr:hypothetical protein ANN_11330 [Periplaneta americana]
MAGLCEGGNETASSLKAICKMSWFEARLGPEFFIEKSIVTLVADKVVVGAFLGVLSFPHVIHLHHSVIISPFRHHSIAFPERRLEAQGGWTRDEWGCLLETWARSKP